MKIFHVTLLGLFLIICLESCGVNNQTQNSYNPNDPFISLWKTTTDNDTIYLPLPEGFQYNFHVDWGDGSSGKVKFHNDPNRIHLYKKKGEYTVKITGLMQAIRFGDTFVPSPMDPTVTLEDLGISPDEPRVKYPEMEKKIIAVVNLGSVGWTNLHRAFYDTAIRSFKGGDTSLVTDMSEMFNSTGIEHLDISTFNTANVTSMADMFGGGHKTLALKHFDTRNVTNMSGMFVKSDVESLDLSSFNTSRVTDMSWMFALTDNLKTLNIRNFDTSRVTNMKSMFQDCNSLEKLDLSHFNTSRVENFSSMFSRMNSLRELNLKNWDTSEALNMSYMFSRSLQIKKLDLGYFETPKLIKAEAMFSQMPLLETVVINKMNFSQVKNISQMFSETPKLKKVYVHSRDLDSSFKVLQKLYLENPGLKKIFDTSLPD